MPLHQAAVEVATALIERGHEAYFAGGCVRDRLLGGEPDDYDIATSARPEEVRAVFPLAQGVGESFGVMLVRYGGQVFEIATFRTDGDYADGRRPDEVRFTTAAEDAMRRDFTINGLFQHPVTDEIVDFVRGESDLRQGIIRAIGDPDARFSEDHLRLLRGIRFAARLGFALDPATSEAIRRHAPKLARIARERIGGELRRMLEAPSRLQAIRLVESHGLDAPMLGEPARLTQGGSADAPLSHLAALSAAAAPGEVPAAVPVHGDVPVHVGLAAWALDRSGDRHDGAVAAAERWREALLLSNRETTECAATLAATETARQWDSMAVARRKRWAAGPQARWALLLVGVQSGEVARRIEAWLAETDPASIAPTPFLSGDHLIAAGFAPGPAFREWLDGAYDAQLEGRVTSREGAIEFVRALRGRA